MDSDVARAVADARVEIRAQNILLLYLYGQFAALKKDPLAFVAEAERQVGLAVDGAAMPGMAGYDPEILKHGVLARLEQFFVSLEGIARELPSATGQAGPTSRK